METRKRSPFAQKVRISLDHETYKLLKLYATYARRPMATLAAGIVTDFLAQRAALGDGIPVPGKNGEHTPILHEVIAGVETRVAATLNGQNEQLCELVAMVDKLAEAVLLHAPETQGDPDKQVARGQRRYETWQALVMKKVGKRA